MESGQPGGNSSRMQMTKAVLFASCFWMLVVFGSCTGQQPAPPGDAVTRRHGDTETRGHAMVEEKTEY